MQDAILCRGALPVWPLLHCLKDSANCEDSIPTKDILSWYFDEPLFDHDAPLYIDAEDESRTWTANQCKKAIRQIAAGFKANGLEAGDTVCIHSFNELNYPILVNGILGCGGVYTGANPAYTYVTLCAFLARQHHDDSVSIEDPTNWSIISKLQIQSS